MATRTCDRCGSRIPPRWPRTQVNGQMWCSTCVQNSDHVQTTAAGWSGEDVIRHELGRQKVHDVYADGRHAGSMCPEHLRMHQSRSDFANGVAAQVGLDHKYPTVQVSPAHEGKCTECARANGTQSLEMPWNPRPVPGARPVHEERQPTPHNEGDDEGMGYQQGRYPYRAPLGHEQHKPFVPGIQSMNMRVAVVTRRGREERLQTMAVMRVQAHDSGDGETIFHCGASETRYWTIDGIKTLGETVGTVQKVLVNTGGGGVWLDAMIHSFGEQRLWKITLRRNGEQKELFFTAEHRWLVKNRDADDRSESRDVVTRDLEPGMRLPHLLPRSPLGRSTPGTFGIAQGIVYGDGTRAAKGSVVNLWGEKQELLRYFNETGTEPRKTPNGVEGVHVKQLPAFFKERPAMEESVSHLYGWLAGYFAADGHVSKTGQITMESASRADLEFVELLAMRLGIGVYGIRTRVREGFGRESELHRITFIGSSLRPEFFLRKMHRERFEAVQARGKNERLSWVVEGVEPTDRVEEVYCPRVPEHENFVLDGLINTRQCPFCGSGQVLARSDGTVECEFCSTAFTVQVQPQMPAFPQTIDGVPVDVPGMPAGGQNANIPPGVAPGGPPGPDGDPGAVSGPPGADGGDDDDAENDDDKPAFLKGSMLLATIDGTRLTGPQYMRHLAITHARHLSTVLAQIRNENGRP